MDAPALWEQSLIMFSHTYFERKEKFEMNADSYPIWMLFIVESGKFRFRIGAESGEIGAGELIYCPPGYMFHREMVSPLELHLIGFEFTGKQQTELAPLLPSVKSHPTDRKRLASNFAYLRKLHLAVDPRRALRKQMILNDIWQLTCEVWEGEHQQDELARLADSEDTLMNRAAEWLYQHAHIPFGMSELSSLLGLSHVQFTRRFRKSFRMTPSDFVKSLRIRKAAGLLLDTDLTLNQIATSCGYENGFYLSRVFAQNMGMSPTKYREQNRV
ncbi:helix-turn-helix domain-containing protein [Paenibacillus sp. UNC451MF]|uniref:helix-turn-helix domain-containing protein n=1 Tax=Paenibacillus sp. UNC451MF TaxID=1449063 RepID=UPI00048A9494|nr:helix-turn-helix domain-containing protein [Paenibacillus sp. UNC451MF]